MLTLTHACAASRAPARSLAPSLARARAREPAAGLPAAGVIDVYISSSQRVYLIDIDLFHEATDPLLFTWQSVRAAPRSLRWMRSTGDSA